MHTEYLRERDMIVERSLSEFLDRNFYRQPLFSKCTRTDEKAQQMLGSDIIISIPELGIYDAIVDEKAQLAAKYINEPLPTFSLELDFRTQNREVVNGWFVDRTKTTTHYLFMWINKALDKYEPKASDFQEVEYVLINRQKLENYFALHGLTLERLISKAKDIRINNVAGQIDRHRDKPYWFYYSDNLFEAPINLIVKKELYIILADKHGIITNN